MAGPEIIIDKDEIRELAATITRGGYFPLQQIIYWFALRGIKVKDTNGYYTADSSGRVVHKRI